MIPPTNPIPPNTVLIDPGGARHTVGAVGTIGGERYYWLVSGERPPVVSMFPAYVVEAWTVDSTKPGDWVNL